MIISFDLDDTLIPGMNQFPLTPQYLLQRLVSREQLRAGTIPLMRELKKRQWKIYIYTTSYRKPRYIRQLFCSYGISINKAINKTIHDKTLGATAGKISKYPPAFNINIHVDDAPGVALEGERYNFSTLIIAADDRNWTKTILNHLTQIYTSS